MRARFTLIATILLMAPLTTAAQRLPWRAGAHLGSVSCSDRSNTLAGTSASLAANAGLGIEAVVAYAVAASWEVELSWLRSSIDLAATSNNWPAFDAGSADLAVVTLALQYRPFTTGRLLPHVGAGIHLAMLSDLDPTSELTSAGITGMAFSDEISATFQVGLGYRLSERLAIDLRATYHDHGTDAEVTLNDAATTRTVRLDLDPWMVAAGIDFRF